MKLKTLGLGLLGIIIVVCGITILLSSDGNPFVLISGILGTIMGGAILIWANEKCLERGKKR